MMGYISKHYLNWGKYALNRFCETVPIKIQNISTVLTLDCLSNKFLTFELSYNPSNIANNNTSRLVAVGLNERPVQMARQDRAEQMTRSKSLSLHLGY
jgi:hypothetical protein